MSNIPKHMDTTRLTDQTSSAAEGSPEEHELARYLDGLISATLARRSTERALDDREAEGSPPDGPAVPASGTVPVQEEIAACPADDAETGAPARSGRRASMREDMLKLFRSPERLASPPAVAEYLSASASSPDVAPLPARQTGDELRRHVPQAMREPTPVSTGFADLDDHLGGGFRPGAYLVTGRPGIGKTAFLESVAWETLTARRPVLYYALRGGVIGARARLLRTLGSILDSPPLPPHALRDHELDPNTLALVTALDLTFRSTVLPWLSLIDTVPACAAGLGGFIEDLRRRSFVVGERHGTTPLVLVDDLGSLLLLTGARSPRNLLSRLDTALQASSLAGLIAMSVLDPFVSRTDGLPSQTTLALVRMVISLDDTPAPVALKVQRNTVTGWTGTVPLLLDGRSGLFAPGFSSET